MGQLWVHCPLWSTVRAYYRFGHGAGDNWYWAEPAEDVPVDGMGTVTFGRLTE